MNFTPTIHSIGDGAFLYEIMNAIAMVIGNGDFNDMCRIGFLIGIIIIFATAISTGGRSIDVGKIFAIWLFYTFMYGSSTNVIVEDHYDGTSRVISHVPTGIAVSGSIISQFGYGLTDMMETAFSTPAMSTQGFNNGITVVKIIRSTAMTRGSFAAANDGGIGADFWDSWKNYVRDCTTVGITMGQLSVQQIQTATDVKSALRWDSWRGTAISDGTAATSEPTCTDAWPRLMTLTAKVLPLHILRNLGPKLPMPTTTYVEADVETVIDTALGGLGISTTAQNFVLYSILERIYHEGVVARYNADLLYTQATAEQDAINQRQSQWFGQLALFTDLIRPMLTIIEGLTYAVTPLLAFAILLGGWGISAVGRWFQTSVWIQLWMPTLAVVQLYISMSVTQHIGAIEAAGVGSITTMGGLFALDDIAMKWAAYGGYIASSVPAITLAMVGMGSVGVMAAAGRDAGTFDSKRATPDTMGSVPNIQLDSPVKGNYYDGGYHLTAANVGSRLATLGQSMSSDSAVSSAAHRAHQTQQQFSNAVSNATSESWRAGVQSATNDVHKVGSSVGSSSAMSKFASDNRDAINNISKDTGKSFEEVAGAGFMASISGGLQAFGTGASIGGKSGLNFNEKTAQSFKENFGASWKKSAGSESQYQARMEKMAAEEMSTSSGSSFAHDTSFAKNQNLSTAASEAVSASRAFDSVQSLRSAAQAGFNPDAAATVARLSSSSDLAGKLHDYSMRSGAEAFVQQGMKDYGPTLTAEFGGSRDQAENYLRLTTMMGLNPDARSGGLYSQEGGAKLEQMMGAAAQFWGAAHHMGAAPTGGAFANAGVALDAPSEGSVRSMTPSLSSGPAYGGGTVQSAVDKGIEKYQGNVSTGRADIQSGDAYNRAVDQKNQNSSGWDDPLRSEQKDVVGQVNDGLQRVTPLGVVKSTLMEEVPNAMKKYLSGHPFTDQSTKLSPEQELKLSVGALNGAMHLGEKPPQKNE